MDIGGAGPDDDLDAVHELTDEELIAIELAAVELGYD